MSVKRPRREQYRSEPDFLLACLRYLDAKYPGREGQRQRIAAFHRWEAEHTDSLRERISDLLVTDGLSLEQEQELDRLTTEWKARQRRNIQTSEPNERNR